MKPGSAARIAASASVAGVVDVFMLAQAARRRASERTTANFLIGSSFGARIISRAKSARRRVRGARNAFGVRCLGTALEKKAAASRRTPRACQIDLLNSEVSFVARSVAVDEMALCCPCTVIVKLAVPIRFVLTLIEPR